MELYIEFLTEQWVLALGLAFSVALLVIHETRKGAPGISPQQLTNFVNKQNGLVLDLRDASEYKAGHIVDAINLPHAEITKRAGELDKFKDRPLILVCKMGQHSGAISKQLKLLGHEQLYKLSGGITEWQTSQLPLVKK